jgi:hypothetical protein
MRLAAILLAVLLAGCLVGPAPPSSGGTASGDRVSLLLTNERADRVVLRAYYVPGREPVQPVMDWLAGRVQDLTGKAQVTVAPFEPLATGTDSIETNWTSERAAAVFESLAIPDEARTVQLVFLFLDGYGYNGYGTAAGWQAEHYIGVWPDTFRGAGMSEPVRVSVPVPDPEGKSDRNVLLHETGHMLGLVDNGAPMVRDHVDRADPCRCHSSNPDSIMATGFDLAATVRHLVEPRDLDADDLADLRAFQDAAAAG